MNGHQMLRKPRSDSWGKGAKVIFLTNLDDPANPSQGFELKGNDYIIKSNISLSEVSKRVNQYLGGYHD